MPPARTAIRGISAPAVLATALFVSAAGAARADAGAPLIPVVSPPMREIAFPDPFVLYGGKITFDVYRAGQKVGTHRVDFARDGELLRVNAEMDLQVNVLFFTAYRFSYRAQETWANGSLIAASSEVYDNGKRAWVNAGPDDGAFRIDASHGTSRLDAWAFPTNHWHRGQVAATTLLNSITGRPARVETRSLGLDVVETAAGPVTAEQFEYTGDLRDTRVWYDADGRWVKMSFKARDGSWIEYRCTSCGRGQDAPT